MSNQRTAATTRRPGIAGNVQPTESRASTVPVIVPGSQLLFRIPEAMEMLSLSRSVMYKQLRSGRIRSVGQGRGRRITASALLEYIDLLERETAKKRAAKNLATARSPRGTRATLARADVKEDLSEQENR